MTNRGEVSRSTFSNELSLIVECCLWVFDPESPPAAQSEGSVVDWSLFLRLARFHRVQGLVWNGLAGNRLDIPSEIAEAIAGDATMIAAANLQSAAESSALLVQFERAGISLLFVKGLALGVQAYGSIAIKAGVDIDLLVEPTRLDDACAVLRERGYRLSHPSDGTSMAKLERWHRLRKESTWVRPDSRVPIDLHTRLADNPRVIPTIGVSSPRQMVEVAPGICLPTLGREELFAYLAVHGASSAWFRLKWIVDFVALIHGCSPEDLERLYRRSEELGAGRASAQALLLADHIYGTLGKAPSLKRLLECDGRTRRLLRTALRQLSAPAEPVEPTARLFGTLAIHYSQFLLIPGSSFKLSELIRQARASLA